jgi:uncharacterized membrane protein
MNTFEVKGSEMKPFNVNRDSWHYKLNQKLFNTYGDNKVYMSHQWEPRHNNFCAYWRATVFRLLGAAFLATFPSLIPRVTLQVVLGTIGMIGLIVAGVAIISYLDSREPSTNPDSLFVQKIKSHKAKVCPYVEFK